MIALLLCALAFATSLLASRRSLVGGLGVVLSWGYLYGIMRANVPSTFSHFIFDAAVLGLYATQFFRSCPREEVMRTQSLRIWVSLLVGWPLLLLLVPIQDPLVQLVGLRANIFFVPFLLFGPRLGRGELYRLALILAGLNLLSFGFAVAEFFMGVPTFFPRNEVTELLYRSNDIRVEGSLLGAFRIPATFANAAQYGSTMVVTLPFLIGGWLQRQQLWHRAVFLLALGASGIGVFLSATRTNMLMLGVIVLVGLLFGGMGVVGRFVWVLLVGVAGWTVSTDERLFNRLLSINPDAIIERFTWSMNTGVLERMMAYPLGNGLGGGGTSLPYFLVGLVRNPVWVENQWATIMLEQGLPGLMLWVGFLVWALSRRSWYPEKSWRATRRLLWVATILLLATGLIGQGLFAAVPTTVLLFLAVGWLAVPMAAPEPAAPADPAVHHDYTHA